MIRVAVSGASGRMGLAVQRAIENDPEITITGAIVSPQSVSPDQSKQDNQPNNLDLRFTADVETGVHSSHVTIDFSVPHNIEQLLGACTQHRVGLVIGTTGHTDAQTDQIRAAAELIPIVFSPNMSIGVNLLWKLVDIASQITQNVDVEIVETHHRYKVDAPSGTALRIGNIIASNRGHTLSDVAAFGRGAQSGSRNRNEIAFHSVRGGEVAGEHTVKFLDDSEHLEISHRAMDRSNFATGAVRAAKFVARLRAQQSTGLYSMNDVLDIQ